MSPLGSGPLGSPDWQRVANWDGPVLLSAVTYEMPKGVERVTPVFDVSRYSALALNYSVIEGGAYMNVGWFGTSALGPPGQTRLFRLGPTGGTYGQLRLSNLGPFVQIGLQGSGESNKISLSAQPTNRPPQQEAIPYGAVILKGAKTFAANETYTEYSGQLASGILRVSANTGAAKPFYLRAYVATGDGEELPIGQAEVGTSGFFGQIECYLPPLPLKLEVHNLATEQSINWAATVQPG